MSSIQFHIQNWIYSIGLSEIFVPRIRLHFTVIWPNHDNIQIRMVLLYWSRGSSPARTHRHAQTFAFTHAINSHAATRGCEGRARRALARNARTWLLYDRMIYDRKHIKSNWVLCAAGGGGVGVPSETCRAPEKTASERRAHCKCHVRGARRIYRTFPRPSSWWCHHTAPSAHIVHYEYAIKCASGNAVEHREWHSERGLCGMFVWKPLLMKLWFMKSLGPASSSSGMERNTRTLFKL